VVVAERRTSRRKYCRDGEAKQLGESARLADLRAASTSFNTSY
jgi:hypothetical protein